MTQKLIRYLVAPDILSRKKRPILSKSELFGSDLSKMPFTPILRFHTGRQFYLEGVKLTLGKARWENSQFNLYVISLFLYFVIKKQKPGSEEFYTTINDWP